MEDCQEWSESSAAVFSLSHREREKTPKTATSVAVRIYLVGRVSEASPGNTQTIPDSLPYFLHFSAVLPD